MKSIENSDITFVVQGATLLSNGINVTQKCVNSVRKYFPGAKIVVSTWPSAPASSIYGIDSLLLNEDPGPISTKNSYLKNYNRMVVSTYSGLASVNTTYAAKVRSDFWFEGPGLIKEYYATASPVGRHFAGHLKGKILMCMYSGHYKLFPYYISDWFHFGYANDLRKLWASNLILDSDCCYKPALKPFLLRPFYSCDAEKNMDFPLHSEQKLAVDFLRRIGVKHIDPSLINSPASLARTYMLLGEAFDVVPRYGANLVSYKHKVTKHKNDLAIWKEASRANRYDVFMVQVKIILLYVRSLASAIKRLVSPV